MLTKRIIPCLDVMDGRVVKGVNFVNFRDAGDPVENARFYDEEGADELTFLDITASHEKRDIILDVVKRTAEEVFMPLTVGGGVRTLEDIEMLLKAGADKVSINTAAVKNPEFVKHASRRFGSQCIVVAIDSKARKKEEIKEGDSAWEIYINGGRTPTGIDTMKWAHLMEEYGAGEFLLTSMDADGTLDGYDIGVTSAVSEAVSIPVIASGGAGNLDHLYHAFKEGKADAVLAASIFHFRTFSIKECKDYLDSKGIPMRLDY